MKDLIYDNSSIFEYFIKNNRNLKDLSYDGNILIFNNKRIDTKNINIKEIIKPYSKLALDLKLDNITSDSFYDIILINTLKIEENNISPSLSSYALDILQSNFDNNKYDIININHFKSLMNNYNNLNESEYKDFNNFINYMILLLIQDNNDETYLNDEQLNTLNKFKNIMTNSNNNELINKYNTLIKQCEQEKKRRENKILRLEKKDGYANAFLVIFMLLITGIIIGTLGYFFM